MNLLEYNNALVTNDFSSVPYSNRADIQYDIAINGEKHSGTDHSTFAGTTYTPDDDYHIIWPDITDTPWMGHLTVQNLILRTVQSSIM